ncbi:MAG: hypothetical protein IIA82_09825 [Thaumarchaeota archaeon]|nr:hypothetical protein [Nitrososphaerota archaeon]
MNLSNYFVNETAVPEKTKGYLPEQIIKIAASLSVQGNKFNDLATALNIEESNLTLQKRIDHTATLDALVAHHYGIDKKNYEYIVNSFNFVENRDILNKKELVWNDSTIKQFYYEVRKIVLQKYDEITTMVRNG